MIVRKHDDGSMILINQTDHAKLSGFFAAHWGNADFAPPAQRESAMRAAMFHDNGWLRYETAPVYDPVEKMSPSFFQSKTDATQLAAYGWAIDWLTDIDPYAGLLISRHRTGLVRGRYGAVQEPPARQRPLDPMVEAFTQGYEAKQDAALAGTSRRIFDIDYQMLQFWDLFSLSLCLSEPRETLFAPVPTSYDGDGRDGVRVTMTPKSATELTLDPYPFDTRPLSFGYLYRHLPTCDFADVAAFRAAYFAAPPLLREFTFV